MNLKNIFTYSITLVALPFFTSCDGGSVAPSLSDSSNESTAPSLQGGEIFAGDRLTWTPANNAAPLNTSITFSGRGVATQPSVQFQYRQSGPNLFTITQQVFTTPFVRVNSGVTSILGRNTTETPLSVRFRELIQRQQADFSEDELREIADILNPFGANLFVYDDEERGLVLATTLNNTYTHIIDSSIEERNRGFMSGRYFAEGTIELISFRQPTATELASFRFLDFNSQIPFATGLNRSQERFEEGTWLLEFTNGFNN